MLKDLYRISIESYHEPAFVGRQVQHDEGGKCEMLQTTFVFLAARVKRLKKISFSLLHA